MTAKHLLVTLVLASCGKSEAPAPAPTPNVAPAPTKPVEKPVEKPVQPAEKPIAIDLASVNALVPPALAKQLTFAKHDVARKSTGRDVVYAVFAPASWTDAKLFDVKLQPADKALAETSMKISSKCDGSCKDQDWNAVSERLEFAAHREEKIVTEERGATNHLLVTNGDEGMTYVIYAWWDAQATAPYHTCTVALQPALAPAAAAFAQACKAVAISGHF